MNKKIVGWILVLLLTSTGFYLYLQHNDKVKDPSENKLTAKVDVSPLPTSDKKISLQTTYQRNNQELILKFKAVGNQNVDFDAADLSFTYSDNLSIIRIEPGKALDICPKKAVGSGKVEISCLNELENNQSGKINQELAVVYLHINKFGSSKLIIDGSNTKFYFSGQQIPALISPKEILVP